MKNEELQRLWVRETLTHKNKSISVDISPDASSQLQHGATCQAGQHGEDLRQLVLCQLLGTSVQHHLLHGGTLGVLLPILCHVSADCEAHRWLD